MNKFKVKIIAQPENSLTHWSWPEPKGQGHPGHFIYVNWELNAWMILTSESNC